MLRLPLALVVAPPRVWCRVIARRCRGDARRARVLDLVASGLTVIEVAAHESISTQRVYQILAETRVCPPSLASRRLRSAQKETPS